MYSSGKTVVNQCSVETISSPLPDSELRRAVVFPSHVCLILYLAFEFAMLRV